MGEPKTGLGADLLEGVPTIAAYNAQAPFATLNSTIATAQAAA
jgi:hypothetical protein